MLLRGSWALWMQCLIKKNGETRTQLYLALALFFGKGVFLGFAGPSAFLHLYSLLFVLDVAIDCAALLALFASPKLRRRLAHFVSEIEFKPGLAARLSRKLLRHYATYTLYFVRDQTSELPTIAGLCQALGKCHPWFPRGWHRARARAPVFACTRAVARLSNLDLIDAKDLSSVASYAIGGINVCRPTTRQEVQAFQDAVPNLVHALQLDQGENSSMTYSFVFSVSRVLRPHCAQSSGPLKSWMRGVVSSGWVNYKSLFVLRVLTRLEVGEWGTELPALVLRLLPELVLEPGLAVFADELLAILWMKEELRAEIFASPWLPGMCRVLRMGRFKSPQLLLSEGEPSNLSYAGLIHRSVRRFSEGSGQTEILQWLGNGLGRILAVHEPRGSQVRVSLGQGHHTFKSWRLQRELILRDNGFHFYGLAQRRSYHHLTSLLQASAATPCPDPRRLTLRIF